jgi:uncharacterized membrane protein YhhN
LLLKKYLIYFYLLLLVADLVSIGSRWQAGHYLFKFFLMPVLIVVLVQNKRNLLQKNWRVILGGLVTAWAGDVMLLFSVSRPIFFIIGLVCFLCTHLAYIVYLLRYEKSAFSLLKTSPLLFAAVVLYGIIFLAFLWGHLGSLLIPVIVYTIVISVMMIQALSASRNMYHSAGGLFIGGAAAFIISDSLLAINKFYQPFESGDIFVMSTYGIAQLLIVSAAIKNDDRKHDFIASKVL